MKANPKFGRFKTSSNIIPVINVAFCIMLFLMIISPFLSESRIRVDVPEALTSEEQEKSKITLTITAQGVCILEDKEIKFTELHAELKKNIIADPDQILLIKADKNVPYEWVRRAIEISKSSGIAKIALGTQVKKENQLKH